jgi:vancomycin resistance protein YoaR
MQSTRSSPLKPALPISPRILIWAFGAAALIVTLLVALVIFQIAYANRVLPGVHAWDVNLSGMTIEDATRALDARFAYLRRPILGLTAFGQTRFISPQEIGVRVDTRATAQAAYQQGRGGSLFGALSKQLQMMTNGVEVAPVVSVDVNVAQAYLDALSAELNVAPRDASITLEGSDVVVTPAQAGRVLNGAATFDALYSAAGKLQAANFDLVFVESPAAIVDASSAAAALEALLSRPFTLYLEHPRADDPATWDMSQGQLSSLAHVLPDVERRALRVELDREALSVDLVDLANQLRREPQNARFIFNDDTRLLEVIAPSSEGRELDIEATLAGIEGAIERGEHRAPIVVRVTPAEFNESSTAEALGITENVVTQQTFFAGSPAARMTNIQVAASKLHGVIVGPGEVFSFGHFLGDVSLNEGYAEALIIANGQTVEGVGGGVCQVSTTAFRAAFYGGYPIIERWPHAYRVGYYERGYGPGLDATVFVPEVDFKFKNDTPYHLLIETYTDAARGTLTFKFYSTSDGREVTVSDPLVENVKPHGPPVYEEDPTLPAGEIKQVDYAVDGADVTVTRTVRRDGAVISEDTVFTRYYAWQAVYRVGPEPVSGN